MSQLVATLFSAFSATPTGIFLCVLTLLCLFIWFVCLKTKKTDPQAQLEAPGSTAPEVGSEDYWRAIEKTPEVQELLRLEQSLPEEFKRQIAVLMDPLSHFTPRSGESVIGAVPVKFRQHIQEPPWMSRFTRPGALVVTDQCIFFNPVDLADGVYIPLDDVMIVTRWLDGVSFTCRSGKKYCFASYEAPNSHPKVVLGLVRLAQAQVAFDSGQRRVAKWFDDGLIN